MHLLFAEQDSKPFTCINWGTERLGSMLTAHS